MTGTTAPATRHGVAADGREWELLCAADAITAVTARGTIGEAHVSERGEQVVVELWADVPGVPTELTAQLVTEAFRTAAAREHRPVVVCVPRRDGNLLEQALSHVRDARTRAAGVTCLIEGYVAEDAVTGDGDDVRDRAPRTPGTTG